MSIVKVTCDLLVDLLMTVVDCAKNYSLSTAYTIQEASTVMGRTISSLSFYPGVKGVCDNSIGILNRTFKPRNFISFCPTSERGKLYKNFWIFLMRLNFHHCPFHQRSQALHLLKLPVLTHL